MRGTSASTLTGLVLLATIAIAMALIANNPEAQADGEQIRLQAQRDDQAQAIQQQYAQARATVMAQGLAQLELQRELDAQAVKTKGELDQLEANYQRQVADLQASMGERWGLMVCWLILDVGVAVALVRISGGLARKVGNWAQEIQPNAAGQYPMYLTPEGILAPGRVKGSYLLLSKPNGFERAIRVLVKAWLTLAAARHGEPVTAPLPQWHIVQPESDEAQAQATLHDQQLQMMIAATRGGVSDQTKRQIAERAIASVFRPGEDEEVPIEVVHDPQQYRELAALMGVD